MNTVLLIIVTPILTACLTIIAIVIIQRKIVKNGIKKEIITLTNYMIQCEQQRADILTNDVLTDNEKLELSQEYTNQINRIYSQVQAFKLMLLK
jgi:phosphate/sulfate permease